MGEKEKELLLKDLCLMASYSPICSIFREADSGVGWMDYKMLGFYRFGTDKGAIEFYFEDIVSIDTVEKIKPYLRPMSSMTEEEIDEFILISDTVLWLGDKRSTCILSLEQMDWLNAHHFDYRGLIEKGLAIEVTEDNNPYEN